MEALKDFLKPEVVWAVAGLVMLIAEFALPGLIIFFFGVGALLVAVVCVFADISLNAQLVLFVVASVVLLIALRKVLRGLFMGHIGEAQNLTESMSRFVGQTATVERRIEPGKPGRVMLNGAGWTAEADEMIEKDARVEIVKQESLTLTVKKKEV